MRSTSVAAALAAFALLVSERCDSDAPLPTASPSTSLVTLVTPTDVSALLDTAPISQSRPLDLVLGLTFGAALVAIQLRRKEREWRHRKLSA